MLFPHHCQFCLHLLAYHLRLQFLLQLHQQFQFELSSSRSALRIPSSHHWEPPTFFPCHWPVARSILVFPSFVFNSDKEATLSATFSNNLNILNILSLTHTGPRLEQGPHLHLAAVHQTLVYGSHTRQGQDTLGTVYEDLMKNQNPIGTNLMSKQIITRLHNLGDLTDLHLTVWRWRSY